MNYYEFEIDTLEDHKRNIRAATTWEEYRNAHIAYIDVLIQHCREKRAKYEAIEKVICNGDGENTP